MHETMARARKNRKENRKKTEVRRLAQDLRGRVRTVDAARTLVDLLQRSCHAGLQLVVTKHIGTAARSIA